MAVFQTGERKTDALVSRVFLEDESKLYKTCKKPRMLSRCEIKIW